MNFHFIVSFSFLIVVLGSLSLIAVPHFHNPSALFQDIPHQNPHISFGELYSPLEAMTNPRASSSQRQKIRIVFLSLFGRPLRSVFRPLLMRTTRFCYENSPLKVVPIFECLRMTTSSVTLSFTGPVQFNSQFHSLTPQSSCLLSLCNLLKSLAQVFFYQYLFLAFQQVFRKEQRKT